MARILRIYTLGFLFFISSVNIVSAIETTNSLTVYNSYPCFITDNGGNQYCFTWGGGDECGIVSANNREITLFKAGAAECQEFRDGFKVLPRKTKIEFEIKNKSNAKAFVAPPLQKDDGKYMMNESVITRVKIYKN